MPITPPAASLPDIRTDFPDLHRKREYSSAYGFTTHYRSAETDQQVILHLFKRGEKPRREGGYGLAHVLKAEPGSHVVIDIRQCEAPEEGFLEDLQANCAPDITYTLVTAEKSAADEWLFTEAARLRILQSLTHDTDLKWVLYADQVNAWDADEMGLTLAQTMCALGEISRRLDKRFDGRFGDGFRKYWGEGGDVTSIGLQQLRAIAQMTQWAAEGVRDNGVVGGADEDAAALHLHLDRIVKGARELVDVLDDYQTDQREEHADG